MRRRPDRVKQSKATKSSAKQFGRASTFCKDIREGLELLGSFNKLNIMWRMNRILIQWLKDSNNDPKLMDKHLQLLKGFELNEECLLARRLKTMPDINFNDPEKILFTLPVLKPSEDISAPPGTKTVKVTIATIRLNTDERLRQRTNPLWYTRTQTEIDYTKSNTPEQQIEIPFETETNDIVIIAIALTYDTGSAKHPFEVKDKKWLPAGVVGVRFVN